MRKKEQDKNVNSLRNLMKKLILKEGFKFKKTFIRENSLIGVSTILSGGLRKNFQRGLKFLRFDIFSRDADCQLGGGGGSKENVSKVSAREGPKMGIFGVAADM